MQRHLHVPAAQMQRQAVKTSPKHCLKALFYWRLNGLLPIAPNRPTMPAQTPQKGISGLSANSTARNPSCRSLALKPP